MPASKPNPPEKFGTVLGESFGVPAFSSDYESTEETRHHAFRHYVDGLYMGYKWQCVEYARRWLYYNRGYVFEDIAMAYDIFHLQRVRVVATNNFLPLRSFTNGSQRHPEVGSLLIWDEGGFFEHTGHVAVIVEVHPEYIRIAEQNVDHHIWPDGRGYSRELRAKIDDHGGFWIESHDPESEILGWVIQTDDDQHAKKTKPASPHLFNLQTEQIKFESPEKERWLNIANAEEAAYVQAMNGHYLVSEIDERNKYFCLSETAFREVKHVTNELHYMFMRATEYVLRDDSLLEKFCIPKALWPRLYHSWDNRRNQMITGRFDLAVSENGIKVYEYNADSASCYLECAKIQSKWAEHFGVEEGYCAGEHLHRYLVDAWHDCEAEGTLHILQDNDLEETYHALYMKSVIEQAGIRCKVIKGMQGLRWNNDGFVVDREGEPIRWVWKTWAWETALDQIREQCLADDTSIEKHVHPQTKAQAKGEPRLVDVLLNNHVLVYEPFWTLIPSNKAILPILWELYPNHPALLNTHFELTDELKNRGYAVKPIVGRCGANISIYDKNDNLLTATEGKFENRSQIYQEFFPLPKIGEKNVQISTFTAGGTFAGACARMDASLIVVSGSDLPALRITDH